MSTIPATDVYRRRVAAAAATGGYLPGVGHVVFGRGRRLPNPSDTQLQNELVRKRPESVEVNGTTITVMGRIAGDDTTEPITEAGVVTTDGILMGRRVFGAKELEAETDLEFFLDFQY